MLCASNLKMALVSLWGAGQAQPTFSYLPQCLNVPGRTLSLGAEVLFGRKSPRFLHLPSFGSQCWAVSEVTVRTPFCGTHLHNKTCRTGQHFSTRSGHSEQDDGRTGLETGLAVISFQSKQ